MPPARVAIEAAVAAGDAPALLATLRSLSWGARREAGRLLSSRILPALQGPDTDDRFWRLFSGVVAADTRAYLGTFLLAARALRQGGRITLTHPLLLSFLQCRETTLIDKTKTLSALLPTLSSEGAAPPDAASADAQGTALLRAASLPPKEEYALLLTVKTPLCAWLLFSQLRLGDPPQPLVRALCIQLLRRGDSLAFRLAGILAAWAGIDSLPAQLPLSPEPYQLSRLERAGAYQAFLSLIS